MANWSTPITKEDPPLTLDQVQRLHTWYDPGKTINENEELCHYWRMGEEDRSLSPTEIACAYDDHRRTYRKPGTNSNKGKE
jgi:hypothetical protein